MESVTIWNKKIVLPSPFPKIKLENGLLKNVHASFVRLIWKMLVIFDFSQTFARLAVVLWLET